MSSLKIYIVRFMFRSCLRPSAELDEPFCDSDEPFLHGSFWQCRRGGAELCLHVSLSVRSVQGPREKVISLFSGVGGLELGARRSAAQWTGSSGAFGSS